jgi:hypothetical protein
MYNLALVLHLNIVRKVSTLNLILHKYFSKGEIYDLDNYIIIKIPI